MSVRNAIDAQDRRLMGQKDILMNEVEDADASEYVSLDRAFINH